MKTPETLTRLTNLIKADIAAGRKVKWLEVGLSDRASLVEEIRNDRGPLCKAMKRSGISIALPTIDGVPLRWESLTTQTRTK